jgi:type IV pilus assembly protein PilO
MNSTIRQTFFFAVLLAVPIASFFLVFKPQNDEIARAKLEIDHKKALLEKLRVATSQTEDLQRANQAIRESIDSIQARLPTGKEMDDVLRQVSSLAGKTGLKVPHFKKADKSISAGLAMEQPIEVEITGDFDGFYRFLLELEQLPRITRIPDLAITRSEKVDGEMDAKFTLSIYYEGDASNQP